MNISKSDKFILMALAFAMFMALAELPLAARERRGATVEVTMTDGSQIKGELLAVKSDVLLVYGSAASQGRAIDLSQAVRVKVLRKSKTMLGFIIGVSAGFVIRLFDIEGQIHHNASMKPVLISALVGGGLGTLAGIPEKFSRKGKFFLNERELARLKRHAREDG